MLSRGLTEIRTSNFIIPCVITVCNSKAYAPLVLSAANFEGHNLVKVETDALLEAGMAMGSKVVLGRRISVEFGPKKQRADVQKGSETVITGVCGGLPVVEFTRVFGKHRYTAAVATKISNLSLFEPSSGSASTKPPPSSSSAPKGHAYLVKDGDDEVVEIVPQWHKHTVAHDTAFQQVYLKHMIGFQMKTISTVLPEYTAEDFTVVKRGAAVEVWTARKFKAHELMLAPETTEFKDKYWTGNRAVIAGNTETLNPVRDRSMPKSILCDGRLRATLDKSGRGFALFWLVEHAETLKTANLVLHTAESQQTSTITLPGGKVVTKKWATDDLPQLQIMTNPKAINANVQLLCAPDAKLVAHNESCKRALLKAKAAEDDSTDADQKKRKHSAAFVGGKFLKKVKKTADAKKVKTNA